MSIQKATTKLEGYVIISGMGFGYSVGHAVAIVAPMMGIGIGLSAAAAFFIFWRFFEKNRAGMEPSVLSNLRGLGGGLLGLMAGGTIQFKMPMVDGGLTVFHAELRVEFRTIMATLRELENVLYKRR